MARDVGAFWSYARRLDPAPLEALHEALQTEVGHRLGYDFKIWRDRQDIATGTDWREQIRRGIHKARFLIAVVSPRWLASAYCAEEYELFLEAERHAGRTPVVFPVYYMKDASIASECDGTADPVLSDLRTRQMIDWLHLREPLLTRSVADEEVRRAIGILAAEIADATRSLEELRVQARSERQRTPSPPRGVSRTRRIKPQGTPERPDGPARIELWAGGNHTLTPTVIGLKIGTEFSTATVETPQHVFPLSVGRATVQVDAHDCDIDSDSCFGLRLEDKSENVTYRRLGEWEIRRSDRKTLAGDYFPGVPACQLVNCGEEAGAAARIIAEIADLRIDLRCLRNRGDSARGLTPTKEKLIAIWLKERASEALGGTASRVILHEARLETQLVEQDIE